MRRSRGLVAETIIMVPKMITPAPISHTTDLRACARINQEVRSEQYRHAAANDEEEFAASLRSSKKAAGGHQAFTASRLKRSRRGSGAARHHAPVFRHPGSSHQPSTCPSPFGQVEKSVTVRIYEQK